MYRREVVIPPIGTGFSDGFDIFDDDTGDRVELPEPVEDIVLELPPGFSRRWNPSTRTCSIGSTSSARCVPGTSGAPSVTAAFYRLFDGFTVSSIALDVYIGVAL